MQSLWKIIWSRQNSNFFLPRRVITGFPPFFPFLITWQNRKFQKIISREPLLVGTRNFFCISCWTKDYIKKIKKKCTRTQLFGKVKFDFEGNRFLSDEDVKDAEIWSRWYIKHLIAQSEIFLPGWEIMWKSEYMEITSTKHKLRS